MPIDQVRLNKFLSIPFISQGPIFYPPRHWAENLELEDTHQFNLPAKRLDRADVRSVCRDPENDVLFGYLHAMAWGGQGVGITRRHAINAWQHRLFLSEKLINLRSNPMLSRADAYSLFDGELSIPGLGPSYWTKLIFFFSEAEDRYIMDQWTAKSINYLWNAQIVPMNGHMPDAKKCDGGVYNEFCSHVDELTAIANDRKNEDRIWTGEMIEQRLFSSGGRSPGPFRCLIRQWWHGENSAPAPQNHLKSSLRNSHSEEKLWVVSQTLARGKRFHWTVDDDSPRLTIIRNFNGRHQDTVKPRYDTFELGELSELINKLRMNFGNTGIPLANSVSEMPNLSAEAGLGAALLHKYPPPDTARAQAASQIAALLVELGFARSVGTRETRIHVPNTLDAVEFWEILRSRQALVVNRN